MSMHQTIPALPGSAVLPGSPARVRRQFARSVSASLACRRGCRVAPAKFRGATAAKCGRHDHFRPRLSLYDLVGSRMVRIIAVGSRVVRAMAVSCCRPPGGCPMGNVSSPSRRGLSRAIAIALTAAFSLSLVFAGTTSAASLHFLQDDHWIYPADGSLPTEICPGSTDRWLSMNTSGKDSPLDSNIKGWKVVVPAAPAGNTGNCAVSAWTNASYPSLVIPIANVRNMSFDWRSATGNPPGTEAGGSPRIVVYFDSGDLVAMDALNCRKPIGAFGWARSDFTGFKSTDAPCTIYLNNTVPFANTPTQSAWQVLAAAHPTLKTEFSFMVMDQVGTYYLDRMVFGTQRLYGSSDNPDRTCTTEASC